MKNFFLVLSFLFSSVFAFSQCVLIDIQVLSEPYCPGSLNGGQLQANVSGGTGFYTYEWLNENGGNLPGGPQTSAITNSFLPANQAIWVFVTDTFQNCIDSASYTFTSYSCDPDTAKLEISSLFDINPVGYNTYTECDVKLTNLGCQVSFKPEFIVSHITDTLEQGDFIIEYFNAQSVWEVIPYTINSDGDAIGYWGGQSGQNLNCEEERVRPVRVKFNQFNPEAPLGEYTASLRLWSVDQSGNLLSIISEQDQVTVTLMDTICNTLSISSTVTDASCPEQTDGQIQISSTGGQSPYEYSVNNSTFSSNGLYTSLSSGSYILVVKDSLGCQESDTVFIYPEPSLPDTLWFTAITPFDAVINWTADSTVDGYRFRYREVGQTWQIVASGIFDDNIAEMLSSKSLSGLTPSTTYEVQVRTNSLIDCIEGWSTTYTFTTPMESYTYDVRHTCSGVNSGQILFDVQTLNSYTFEWTGPNGFSSTDTSIYQLAQGDYNLEVSNNNSQIIFDTIISIEVSNSAIDLTLNGDTSLIFESTNGLFFAQTCDLNSYLIADSGFTNYQWSDGTTTGQQFLIDTSDVFVLVEALDSNNCPSISDSVHISIITDYVDLIQANTNQAYIQSNYTLCSSDSSIEIDISPFVSGNYLVEWHQVVGQNFLTLGDSSVIEIFPTQSSNYVLELGNCFFDFSIDYYSPVLDVSNTNLLCNGDTNAYIIVSSDSSSSTAHFILKDSLGVEVYNNISNQLIDTIFGLSSNKYTVELLDEWMCSTSTIVDVTQPDSLKIDSLLIQNILCFGDTSGQVTFKITGGNPSYTISLNGDTLNLTSNSLGQYSIDNLLPNSYTIELTDANGCYYSTSFQIVEPSLLSLSISSSLDSITCFGDSTGFIQVSANGGTQGYDFQISKNDSLLYSQASDYFGSLTAGDYEVHVIDANGCQDSVSLIISQNPDFFAFEDTLSHKNNLCFGDSSGEISFNISGPGSPYQVGFINDTLKYNDSHIFDSLASGFYSFEVTNSLNCPKYLNIEITEPNELQLSAVNISNPNCQIPYGSGDFQLLGGVSPYTFKLNDSLQIINLSNFGDFSIIDLSPNAYTLSILDSNFCVDTLVFDIISTSSFDLVLSSYTTDTLSCFGDSTASATVSLAGGTEPIEYSIFRNDTLLYTQTDTIFQNLMAGDYQVNVIDSFLCVDSVQFSIYQNPKLNLSENFTLHQDVLCVGLGLGKVTIDVSGGTPDYTMGILNDTITYDYPHEFIDLQVGTYVIEVTDSLGCKSQIISNIVTNPISPELVLLNTEDIDCQTLFGSAEFELNNDISPPFTFTLNDQPLTVNLDVNNQFIIDNLDDTAYVLKVEDNSMCTDTLSFDIFDFTSFTLDIVDYTDTLNCFGDSSGYINTLATMGALPYEYVLVKEMDTIAFQSSPNFTNLTIGNYEVVVIDSTGCQSAEHVEIFQRDSIEVSDSLDLHLDVTCYGYNDGEFMPHITGGLPPYTYHFVDSVQDFNYPYLLQNLYSKTYDLEIVDSLGCTKPLSVFINQPDSFYFDSLIITDVICHGDSSGVIDYVLNGGTSPFDYVINSDTSIVSNALASGAYTIEIIDSNNCIIDTNFVVNEPTVLSLSVIDSLTNDISCFGNNDGQIGLTASGGVPPYKFKIDGVLKDTNVIIELLADTFIVAVVDSVGCEDTLEVVLSQPQQNVFVDNYTLSDTLGYCAPCYGDSTGFITIDLLGGTAPFDYFIVSNPDTFNTLPIEKLVGGTEYEIYAKDSLGCVSDTITVECNSPDEIVMSLDLITEPRCCYSCDAEVNLKAVGGITPFVYGIEAMPFQVDSMFSQLCGDTSYLFRVEDSFGCLKLDSMVVPNIPCLTVDTINFVDSQYPAILSDSCQIEGTGKIHVTASEGTGNYNFSINDTMNFIESQQYIYNNLSQGEYVIFVKDSLSCIDSINVEVPEITPITIQLLLDTVYCASPFLNDLTNQTDEGGFTVQAFGSITNTYSYSLDEWDSTIFLNQGVFTLLDPGNYSLNVKDGFDCLSEFEVNVPSISMNYDYTAHDISCAGFNDGYVQINSLQGDVASPWVEVDNSLPNNPNLFTNLGVGEHVITAYYNYPDGSSFCYKTDTFEFFEKEELYFSLEVNSVSCYDDCDASISIDSTYGGAEPYAFICLNNLDTNYLFENLCAGEYSIKMIDDNGCLLIEDIAVNEGNAIYPLISFEDGELTVVQPTLQNPSMGTPPYSYQWYEDNSLLPGAVSEVYNPNYPGLYSVVVTDSVDCKGKSSIYKIEVLDLSNWSSGVDVNIFPNPFVDELNVTINSTSEYEWILRDVSGKVVESGMDEYSWKINTSTLPNGMYILNVFNDDEQLIYKIMKQ